MTDPRMIDLGPEPRRCRALRCLNPASGEGPDDGLCSTHLRERAAEVEAVAGELCGAGGPWTAASGGKTCDLPKGHRGRHAIHKTLTVAELADREPPSPLGEGDDLCVVDAAGAPLTLDLLSQVLQDLFVNAKLPAKLCLPIRWVGARALGARLVTDFGMLELDARPGQAGAEILDDAGEPLGGVVNCTAPREDLQRWLLSAKKLGPLAQTVAPWFSDVTADKLELPQGRYEVQRCECGGRIDVSPMAFKCLECGRVFNPRTLALVPAGEPDRNGDVLTEEALKKIIDGAYASETRASEDLPPTETTDDKLAELERTLTELSDRIQASAARFASGVFLCRATRLGLADRIAEARRELFLARNAPCPTEMPGFLKTVEVLEDLFKLVAVEPDLVEAQRTDPVAEVDAAGGTFCVEHFNEAIRLMDDLDLEPVMVAMPPTFRDILTAGARGVTAVETIPFGDLELVTPVFSGRAEFFDKAGNLLCRIVGARAEGGGR